MLPERYRSSLLDKGPKTYSLGEIVGDPWGSDFSLHEADHLARHMAVLGGTGSGKSKFLELLCRKLIENYQGFCYIDPHGDTVEDLLGFAAWRAKKNGDAILKRIHYLEPTYHTLFAYDPFRFVLDEPITDPLLWRNAYRAWLETKADSVSEIIQRKQGQTDFEGMARLQRWLRNLFTACGLQVDGAGGHLSLADVLVLLNVHHERHHELYQRIEKHLDGETRFDFDVLHGYRRDEERRKETESSINRIRAVLSGFMRAIFSRTDQSIDFRSIIQNRGVLLVNLRRTKYFSVDQANALGGLIIHEIIEAAENAPRLQRVPFGLFIDEAYRFVGTDLEHAIKGNRKHRLMICLAAQDLSSFVKKDVDISRAVLSQCKTTLSFQQQHPEDLKILAQTLGYGNLDFTELKQIVDRPDGFDWVRVEDFSRSLGSGENWSRGTSKSEADTTSRQLTLNVSQQANWSKTKSHQIGYGETDTRGLAETDSTGFGESDTRGMSRSAAQTETAGTSVSQPSDSPDHTDTTSTSRSASQAQSHNESHSASRTESHAVSRNESHAVSRNETQGASGTKGGSAGSSVGIAEGGSHTEGRTNNESTGGSANQTNTVSVKWTHLPRTREVEHPTGRLAMSVEDQFYRMMQQLHGLSTQYTVAKLHDVPKACVVRIDTVEELFATPEDKFAAIEAFKRKLYATHPYFFTPDLSPEEQDRRLDALLQPPPSLSPPDDTQGERADEPHKRDAAAPDARSGRREADRGDAGGLFQC